MLGSDLNSFKECVKLIFLFLSSSIPDCPGVGCSDSCPPRSSVPRLLHRKPFQLHEVIKSIHPSLFWSLPSSVATFNFHFNDALHCLPSPLATCPNHLSLASLTFSIMSSTPHLLLISMILIFSFFEVPTIHRSIRISVLLIKSSSFFLIVQHSAPYISTASYWLLSLNVMTHNYQD